jgi:hypothetical protein
MNSAGTPAALLISGPLLLEHNDAFRRPKQDGILKVMQGLAELHEIRRVCIR